MTQSTKGFFFFIDPQVISTHELTRSGEGVPEY